MDEFRGMKLVRKDADKIVAVNIQVQFDKTKHLSEISIKRRKVIREHLMEKDRQKAAEEEKKLAAEREKLEKVKQKEEVRRQIQLERQRQREERRKQKNIMKITETESSELTKKIHKEQKKLLKTQRKVESIRLLEVLFGRIEKKKLSKEAETAAKNFKGFGLRKKLKKTAKRTMIR
jgi:splicing factor, arginine/serine-rich 17